MNKFIHFLMITVVICLPFDGHAASGKNKKKNHRVQNKKTTVVKDKGLPDTTMRVALLEARLSKLEGTTLKVTQKDLAEGKLPKPIASSANPKSSVKLGGQINRMVAHRDNGKRSQVEYLDSTASSTRFNITGTTNINPKLQVQGVIETELTDGVQSFSSDADIGSAPAGSSFSDASPILRNRRLEAVFKHDKFGTVYLGKGSTSSDGVSEVDFSGTTAVSNASEGGNNLGGFRFYNKTARTSVGQRIASDAIRNMDGLQRANRLRYDSPSLKGFVIGLTHTNEEQSDQSIKYAGSFGKTKVGAAIAHTFQPRAVSGGQSRRRHTYHGSFAIYNAGFSFGAAYGMENYRLKNFLQLQKRKDAKFWFVKVGYQTKFIACGNTAMALDFTYNRANTLAENNFLLANREKSKSYAFTVVQNFDVAATELYFAARQYHFEQPYSSFKDAFVIVVGTRVKF